jgi:hypothetical protein
MEIELAAYEVILRSDLHPKYRVCRLSVEAEITITSAIVIISASVMLTCLVENYLAPPLNGNLGEDIA